MFYAEQKEYPYNYIVEANQHNLKTIEYIDDKENKVMFFKTRAQATKFFKELGWLNSINIKCLNPLNVTVYRNNEYITCGEYDNKTQLEKYLRVNRYMCEWEKLKLSKSKNTTGKTFAYIE